MVGESSALSIGGVISGAMRCAVAEKEHASCFELNGIRLGFIGEAADVVIAVSVTLVGEQRVVGIRHYAHRAVGDGRIVDGDPHRRPAKWLGDFEVGVILMPSGAHAGPAWFEKYLIQMKRDFWSD